MNKQTVKEKAPLHIKFEKNWGEGSFAFFYDDFSIFYEVEEDLWRVSLKKFPAKKRIILKEELEKNIPFFVDNGITQELLNQLEEVVEKELYG